MTMSYRRWFHDTVFGIIGVMLLLSGAAWIIDPIEIWESPVIRGFNHIKPKQGNFLDVFKPFQVRRHAPDIVYIGTSRVYVGFKAEENAYNMGGSSLSLPDMRAYLRFIYSQHVPKRLFIGLDLFQFSHDHMTKERTGKGFSQERLDVLQKGNVAFLGEAWKTSISMLGYLKETVWSSYKKRNKEKEWVRGWDAKRGERMVIDEKAYYHYLHRCFDIYSNYTFAPESIEYLRDILDEAASYDVDVVLFFNPVSIDWLSLQYICGRGDELRRIKRAVAELHPVYDFAWASSLAVDRKGAWLDGSHYHRTVGDQMKAVMTGKAEDEICRVLTDGNVEAQLREEVLLYDQWAAVHSDYVKTLAEVAPKKIPVGTLAQYLGF